MPIKSRSFVRYITGELARLSRCLFPMYSNIYSGSSFFGPASSKPIRGVPKAHFGWDYKHPRNDQLHWLYKHAVLEQLTFVQRNNIVRRSTTAAQLLYRDSLEYGDADDTGTKDPWAEKTVNELCPPSQHVHETLLRGWSCGCHRSCNHSHVLASFATPCQSNDGQTNLLLKFTTETNKRAPWSTVLLNINGSEASEIEAESTSNGYSYQDPEISEGQEAVVTAPALCLSTNYQDNEVNIARDRVVDHTGQKIWVRWWCGDASQV
jgi:hypothetical protein